MVQGVFHNIIIIDNSGLQIARDFEVDAPGAFDLDEKIYEWVNLSKPPILYLGEVLPWQVFLEAPWSGESGIWISCGHLTRHNKFILIE